MSFCLEIFRCDSRGREWETKENNYITQLKRLQDSLNELVQHQASLHDYAINEKIAWQGKEAELNERIAELENQLHQKDVVTQQYKIYEDNFQQERKQILQLQIELVVCREKIENLEREILKLNGDIERYQRKIEMFGLADETVFRKRQEENLKIITSEKELMRIDREPAMIIETVANV